MLAMPKFWTPSASLRIWRGLRSPKYVSFDAADHDNRWKTKTSDEPKPRAHLNKQDAIKPWSRRRIRHPRRMLPCSGPKRSRIKPQTDSPLPIPTRRSMPPGAPTAVSRRDFAASGGCHRRHLAMRFGQLHRRRAKRNCSRLVRASFLVMGHSMGRLPVFR
jgi:hypothetical protein